MFAYAETAIETVKTAKSTVLKTLVNEESFRKPLQSMIDAEAELAKAAFAFMDTLISKAKIA